MALKFRRGSTAQQSGSLAFGEPYVNTTLGTLLVGGASGDITLAVAGTSSAATFGAISGSGLDITGNANIAGNLTLGGNITIGDATTDNVVINADLSSSLIPNNDNAFDIGSTTNRYRNVYAQTISASVLTNLTGSVNKIAYFSANNKLQDVNIFNVINTGSSIGIGTAQTYDAVNPERFIVEAPNTTYNIASFTTNLQASYAQVNIKNIGSGSNASADLVIWNDVSSETGSYLDLGLNSSNYSGNNVGYTNDGYLINAADDLYIGSISSGSNGHLHLFGGALWQSSSISIYNDGTVGINTDKLNNNATTIPTAGFAVEISGSVKFSNGLTVTGSIKAPQLDSIATITGSLITSQSSATVSVSNLNTFSGSQLTQNSSLATITGSLISSASNLTQRVAANEAVSGTFARTNSANTFTGTQTITGSLYISQDLVVAGSSSIQNISSSNLVIGTAYVTLNTNSPSSRYAGLVIVDSGSAGGSGSFFYDSVDDEMIFVHKGNAVNVTSSVVLMGPETYDSLGNETYLTRNKVLKGGGYEHVADSQITDDGTTVSIVGNLDLTGSMKATQLTAIATITGSLITSQSAATISVANLNAASSSYETKGRGIFSGSSQVVGSSITTNTVTIGSTAIALGGTSTTLAGLSSVTSTGFTGALTGNASTATTLQTARLINGTSFDGSANITIANLVSGSSQITLSSTTGYGSVLNQAVLTSSSPTFAGLTINGAITATGDITAYYTSDRRHKNTIQTISNAVLKVKQLNGVTWEWNDDVHEVTKSTPKTGLIAQEVQAVLPQVVTERADGFLALDYSKMVGLLVEAIKEQQIQIDQLKAQIGSK